jgi:glycine betaine/choline ABC-type transport system substrate-binding protein
MRLSAACLGLVIWLCAAPAHAQQVRLAAPSDCLVNSGCGVGLRSVYGLDVGSSFVPLTVADAGIAALDDGLAEVAVAFSSDPQVSRPDIVTLRDDRRMLYRDRVVPIVRRSLFRSFDAADARDIRARLNAASSALSTLGLRALNQAVEDGRLPEAVGGEFVDANGLRGRERRREGPRIAVGYMSFQENETLAHLYAEALRSAGYRVIVRPVGLRPQAINALRRGRVDLYLAYDGSILRYLAGTSRQRVAAGLRRALARINVVPLRLSRAQNRNVFVTKSDTAARLGIARLSDLARFWQPAGA